MKKLNKEWCSITLFNKFSLCLQLEYDLNQVDIVMVGFQIRKGIAFTVLGLTVALEWRIE